MLKNMIISRVFDFGFSEKEDEVKLHVTKEPGPSSLYPIEIQAKFR